MRISDWSSDVCSSDLRTVTIPMPDTDSEVETARILSKNIPEWEKLDKNERAELAKLIVAHRQRGYPATVKLVVKPGGGYSIDMAGKRTDQRSVGEERVRTCRPGWGLTH